MVWSPEFLLTLAAGTLALGAAAGLMAFGFRDRAHRRLALALALFGGADLAFAFAGLAGDPAAADFWRRIIPYLYLPAGLAVLAFVAVYPRARGPGGGLALSALFLGAAVVLDLAYLWDHALYRDFGAPVAANLGLPFAPGPLAAAARLLTLAPAVAALLLARDLGRAGALVQRGPLMLSAAFAAVHVHATAGGLLTRAVLGPSLALPPWMQAVEDLWLFLAAALAVATVVLFAQLRGHADPALRAGARHALALVLLPIATALATLLALPSEAGFLALRTSFDGFWGLVFPPLALYALTGHRLQAVPGRTRAALRNGAAAAGLLAFFLVGEEASRPALGGEASTLLGVAHAAALVAVLLWVQRLTVTLPSAGASAG